MARIYNTRAILDPAMLSLINQRQAQQNQANTQRIGAVTNAFNNMMSGLGNAGQGFYDRYKAQREQDLREKQVNDLLNSNDAYERAIAEEYRRTGNASGLINYRNSVLANQARKEEQLRKAEEAQILAQRQQEIKTDNARPRYNELLAKYYDQNTSNQERVVLEEQLNAMENEFPGIGDENTRTRMLKAKQNDLLEKKAAEQKEVNRADNALDEINEIKQLARNPKITPEQRDALAKDVNDPTKYPFMNQEERTALRKEIYGMETQKEATQKAVKGAIASDSGEQTKKKMEKTRQEENLSLAREKASNYTTNSPAAARREAENLAKEYGINARAVEQKDGSWKIEVN